MSRSLALALAVATLTLTVPVAFAERPEPRPVAPSSGTSAVPAVLRTDSGLAQVVGFGRLGNSAATAPWLATPLLAGVTPGPLQPTASSSIVFHLDGEFLVCNKSNYNWRYTMSFGSSKTIHKVILDVDVYVSGWDPSKQNGYHNVMWLQFDKNWGHMLGYLNLLGTGKNRTRLEMYYGYSGNQNQVKNTVPSPGSTYHVHYEYDPITKQQGWYEIRKGGNLVVSGGIATKASSFTASAPFVEFGTQLNSSGPEATTYGWRFSNARIEFVP